MGEFGRTNRRSRVTYTVLILVWLLTVGAPSLLKAAEVSIQAILAEPDKFDQQTVTVRGQATEVKVEMTHRHDPYTVFVLLDASGSTLRVFAGGPSEVKANDKVEVTGVFQKVIRRMGSYYHNAVIGANIMKAPPD